MSRYPKRIAAFTLIEIIVVIAIIIVLIGLLLPVLAKAKASAKRTTTQGMMSGIQTACDSYYQMFRAYPGMIAETTYDGNVVQYSSSQALVVSLSRFFCTPTADATSSASLQIAGLPVNTYVSTDPSVSPRDYSENTIVNAVGNPTGRKYAPYNTRAADLSPSITTSPTSFLALFPTFIDSPYGAEALPILYYRAARKYDSSVTPPMNRVGVAPSDPQPAGFYASSNAYLGMSAAMTGTSSTYQASKVSGLDAPTLDGNHILTELVNGVPAMRGDYVLISAGTDRVYGSPDDIIVSGGN